MNKQRNVQKGNVKEGSFDVRITESDGKAFYYHFLQLEDGESAIYVTKPFNLKGEINVSWDDLPIKVKESHYKNICPNDNINDYDKKCFLYGKQNVDKQIAIEEEKRKQRKDFIDKVAFTDKICSHFMAGIIYDSIGKWDLLQVIYEKGSKGKFCVDNKIVTIEHFEIVSIEDKATYDAERKAWGERVSRIAKAAGTSFDMATVVGNVTDTDKAIELLKEIVEKLNSDEFESHMKSFLYRDYNINEGTLKSAIIDFFFFDLSSTCRVTKLNMSHKFCNAVRKILNNK